MCVSATQSCPILCDPVNGSWPGSSVRGILQARILEWIAISSSRGTSQPRDQTLVSCISCTGERSLYHWATWEVHCLWEWSINCPTFHLSLEEAKSLRELGQGIQEACCPTEAVWLSEPQWNLRVLMKPSVMASRDTVPQWPPESTESAVAWPEILSPPMMSGLFLYHLNLGLAMRLLGGLPWWFSGKESACQCRRHRFDPWSRKIPWSKK